MSDTPPAVHEVLAAVMRDVPAVAKAERNTQQGFKFRGIDAVINSVGPKLRQHGVIVTPVHVEPSYRDVSTRDDKRSHECTIVVTYRIYGPAGDYLDIAAPGEGLDLSDKATAKAMSVAYRTALLQALCLPTDEPDPDSEYPERATSAPQHSTSDSGQSAGELRSQIMALTTERGLSGTAVVTEFENRAKQKFAEADAQYLASYLRHLQSQPADRGEQ